MKKMIFLLSAAAMICQSFALQSNDTLPVEKQDTAIKDGHEDLTVVVGNDLIRFVGNDSIVIVKMGNRALNIRETPEGRKLDVEKYEPEINYDRDRYWGQEDNDRDRGARYFRGHWAGFEIGFNNYNHVSSNTLPPEISYMTLDASNSNCFNLNFTQANIGFGRHSGLVTGLGLNWNTYRFEGSSTIGVVGNGTIGELIPADIDAIKKSKFDVLYLNVPLLLEVQIPAGYSSRLSVAAGVIGGLKIHARTKLLYEDGEKVKTRGDYNLNLLRGGVTGRIGFENLTIFGTYYLTPWFQDLKGPEGLNLEPFEIGLAFTFND